jgi:hypothetical protein
MKVLIAADGAEATGWSDVESALDGELVISPRSDCDDPRCSCSRGWQGVVSGRFTRAATVVERPDIDADDLRAAIFDALDRDGWVSLIHEIAQLAADSGDSEWDDPDETIQAIVDEHLEVIEEICRDFADGTVLRRERRGADERVTPSAA